MTRMKKDEYAPSKCLELALEGERLCKLHEFDKGINQFKAALEFDTNDHRVLSAIYSQLGNAYFYKKDFQKALAYHDLDLKFSRQDNDLLSESKACGNLGNTYKMLKRFDEAIHYCTKHLEIARLLGDRVSESRALYNLGNVYYMNARTAIDLNRNLIDFPAGIKECLLKALESYKLNLELMKEVGDREAQGRAFGNIGNTYYLLGEFQNAIEFHNIRLQIAKECGDREAERRAHFNLGHAQIFCGEFEKSIDCYQQSLFISQEIGNPLFQAQAYYSIGNVYFLLKDYKSAIEYFLKHLKLAQVLEDKLGQSRAYCSLANAYNELGDTEGALRFASYHLQLAKETNDKEGEETANKSVTDLKRKLEERNLSDISTKLTNSITSFEHNLKVKDGIDYFQCLNQRKQPISSSTSKLVEVVKDSEFFNKNNLKRNINHLNESVKVFNSRSISEVSKKCERSMVLHQHHYQTPLKSESSRKRFQSRQSMENMEIMKLTPTTTTEKQSSDQIDNKIQNNTNNNKVNNNNQLVNSSSFLSNTDLDDNDHFLDLLASFQSKRMDDQRCSLDQLIDNKENHLPEHKLLNKTRKASLNPSLNRSVSTTAQQQQSAKMKSDSPKEIKRRSSNPSFTESTTSTMTSDSAHQECRDELFDLIEGIQSRRMDEQRAPLPPLRRSHTTQETHLPKNTSSTSIVSSADSQADRTRLHRMSTNVEINSDQIKHNRQMSFSTDILPDDDFFDQLMRCQASRLDSQRTALPSFAEAANNNNNEEVINQNLINNPQRAQAEQQASNQSHNEEEFLSLLMRFQAGRIEEQRSNLHPEEDLINLNSSGSTNVDSTKDNKNVQG